MPAAKRAPAVDLAKLGAHVVSVYGPFNSRVLIEMSAERAAELFPDGMAAAAPSRVLTALDRDLAVLRGRAPDLADSTLAASAAAMAFEIEHPYNSATSKSMCQARLVDALRELRELAPPKERPKDGIDQLKDRRAKRRAARSAAS